MKNTTTSTTPSLMAIDPAGCRFNSDTPHAEEIGVFIEQARWLLEYHDRRSESVSTRAVALLGFAGVVLALLLQARLPDRVVVTGCIKTLFVVTVAAVLVTAGLCVYVLTTRQLIAPAVGQLRKNWRSWALSPRSRGSAASDVAESLLRGKRLEKESPLDATINAANRRASAFSWAVRALALALFPLTVLLIAVGVQL